MYDPNIVFQINLMTGEFNRIMSKMPQWFHKWGEEGKDFEVLSSTLHGDKSGNPTPFAPTGELSPTKEYPYTKNK